MSISGRFPTVGTAAGLVPTLWSKHVLDAVHSSLVILPLVDHTWEPELVLGNIMNVGILNEVAAIEVSSGTVGSLRDIGTGALKAITINQWWECPVVLDDMTNLQTQVNLVEKAQREGGYAISKKIDATIGTLFATLGSAAGIQGADGAAITDDVLIESVEVLDEADAPQENRAFIFDPSAKADMLKIDKFVRTDYVREAVIPTGKFGSIYGCPVFITNNLQPATTGGYGCLLQEQAIAVIVQENMKVDVVVEPLKHMQTINTHALWGVLEMRDSFGVCIYTRKQ